MENRKLTQKEYAEIKNLVECIISAHTKKDAERYLTRLSFLSNTMSYEVAPNIRNMLSELVSCSQSAAGQVRNKEHWVSVAKSQLYKLESFGVEGEGNVPLGNQVENNLKRLQYEDIAKVEIKQVDEVLQCAYEAIAESRKPKLGKNLALRPGNKQDRKAESEKVRTILYKLPYYDEEIRVEIEKIADFVMTGNSLSHVFLGGIKNKYERKINDAKKWLSENP